MQNKDPTYALWMKVSRLEEVSEQLAAFAKHYRQFIISTQKEMENDVTIRNLVRFAVLISAQITI